MGDRHNGEIHNRGPYLQTKLSPAQRPVQWYGSKNEYREKTPIPDPGVKGDKDLLRGH